MYHSLESMKYGINLEMRCNSLHLIWDQDIIKSEYRTIIYLKKHLLQDMEWYDDCTNCYALWKRKVAKILPTYDRNVAIQVQNLGKRVSKEDKNVCCKGLRWKMCEIWRTCGHDSEHGSFLFTRYTFSQNFDLNVHISVTFRPHLNYLWARCWKFPKPNE